MPDVVKHAWTHRPRAQGGTDPIEVAAAGGLKWAQVEYGQRSHTIALGEIRMRFQRLQTNAPDVFSLDTLSSDTIRGGGAQWADFVEASEAGYYLIFYQVNTNVRDVFNGFETYVEPLDRFGGPLINSLTTGQWFSGLSSTAEFFNSPEWDHQSLWGSIGGWNTGVNPFKVGLRIDTAMTGSVTVGCEVLVLQIANEDTGAYSDESI